MTNTMILDHQSAPQAAASCAAPSIYQQALGADFDRLHPRMQERFGFSSEDCVAHVGTGTMHSIRRSSRIAGPFLRFMTRRNLLFPETGTDVPFTVANYAYKDTLGRETVTWHRTFKFDKKTRVFDATMIYNPKLDTIVDYLGTHQHIAADLDCWVDDQGGMNFASADQRFYEGPLAFLLPAAITGQAQVREWWDETIERYRIDVHVANPVLGTIVHYQGSFDLEIVPIMDQADVPALVRPVREEARD